MTPEQRLLGEPENSSSLCPKVVAPLHLSGLGVAKTTESIRLSKSVQLLEIYPTKKGGIQGLTRTYILGEPSMNLIRGPLVKSSVMQHDSVIEAKTRYLRPYHIIFYVNWQCFAKVFVRFWPYHAVFGHDASPHHATLNLRGDS